ncbi:MAG: DUF1592 domain-containing protein [Verrucomicrobiota bacterium]
MAYPISRNLLKLSLLGFLSLTVSTALTAPANKDTLYFEEKILPTLKEYCFDCHGDGSKKGGVTLDKYNSHEARTTDIKGWLAVWGNLDSQLMPPNDKAQPSSEQVQAVKEWIERSVFKLNPNEPDPGRVTVRRLNRTEYRNSVRDLTGVDFPVMDQLPADDTGYGFDTIGDVLNISPLLMEKYLEAAESITQSILNPLPGPQGRKLFTMGPPHPDEKTREVIAKNIIQGFAFRAIRRPVEPEFLDRLMSLYNQAAKHPDMSFEKATAQALAAVLASPRFIFRTEIQSEPDNPAKVQDIDEYSLATRLSYFLWSTTPDEELLTLAKNSTLRSNLRKQVDRMIKDYRFNNFSPNFVGQWLQTRDVESVPIQANIVLGIKSFEEGQRIFTEALRRSMRQESEMLFTHLIQENRPTIEFLTAKYTFLNESLANFYGIPNVTGSKMRKVDLAENSQRGGFLTHGSFLVVTSNPTRTSPVKRGLFVLENLLGTPAPPAPPDVPTLESAKKGLPNASMRQLMEMHRQKPLCASCHARMDPIGLALENFSAAGKFRDNDNGKPIDSAGVLITGEKFNNIAELTNILATRRSHDFYRCLVEKALTYALGRGVEYYDTPTIEKIVRSLEKDNGSARNLLYEIIESVPFQKRRGDGQRLTNAPTGTSVGK